MQRASGYVEKGVTTISINGVTQSANVQRCYPSATVTVYDAGTLDVSTIYGDNGVTLKSNPFTSGADASWFFYAADGKYDVKFSGGGITTPWTLADVLLDDAAAAADAVTSVFGRTGVVAAYTGDYSFSLISGTVASGQLPAAGGDLSGTLVNATVAKLQGRAMVATAPTHGQGLVWDSAGDSWTPGTPTVAASHASLTNLGYDSAGHTGFVSITSSQTLLNKTLTTPYVADFTNATHDHEDAAGGGQIDSDAISGYITALKGGTGITGYLKGDLLVASTTSSLNRLAVGTDGQLLSADSGASYGVAWVDAEAPGAHDVLSATHSDAATTTLTRGDIIVAGAAEWDALNIGSTGEVLVSDGTDPAWGHAGIWVSTTLDFGTGTGQMSTDLTVAVTGAAIGDPVALGTPAAPDANACFTAWVSATNVVTVRFNNYGTSTVDPASGTYKVLVFK